MIATKFPSYAVRHPNKVVWLVHQFRQAYDFDGTELGQFGDSPFDRATVRGDPAPRPDDPRRGPRGCSRSRRNVADRLERSTGLEAEVLPPPPQNWPTAATEYGDFVLSVGRLDREKRVDLLLEAAAARRRPAGRRCRRRSRARAARAASPASSGSTAASRSRAGWTRTSSSTSTPTASPCITRRSTRTTVSSRMRRSCPRSRW